MGFFDDIFSVARQVIGAITHSTINTRTIKVYFQRWPGRDAASGIEHGVSPKTVNYTITSGGRRTTGTIGEEGLIEVPVPAGGRATLEVFGTTYTVTTIPALEDNATDRGRQRRLEALGYEHGGVDGIVGPKTDRSILNFQADHDPLVPLGIVNADTQNSLKTEVDDAA